MENINIEINLKFLLLICFIQFLIICLNKLRSLRFLNLDVNLIRPKKKLGIEEIQLYLSFTRWIGFVFPFKIGEVISFYILKKKIIRFFSPLLSYFFGCKFFELFILLSISVIVCSIFFLETKVDSISKIFLRFFYIFFLIIFSSIILYLKKNKKKILKINFKIKYLKDFKILINSKNFFSYTFVISFIQFLSTILLIFICSDRVFDNELFFLSTAYILLNIIPFRLPLNIGIFDFIAGAGDYIYNFGLSVENLIFFRILQLILYSFDFIFWYIVFLILKPKK